jgi:3-phosphoshikimate 1-carboxyvinyltransferase
MQLISSPVHTLNGTIVPPGDKSLSHRAILFASLADGTSHIENFLSAGVTDVMLASLASLGVRITHAGNELVVHGQGIGGYIPPQADLGCGNSATTMRLLTGALAAAGTPAVLDGSTGLRSRPMIRIITPLQRMGVPIHASEIGTAPLHLGYRPGTQLLKAMDYTLPVASAQVKSCLLLAALSADGDVTLREPGPSRDHTERMLRGMGAAISSRNENHQYVTEISPLIQLEPIRFTIPGDLSSAAFLIVAALIVPDTELTITSVGLNPTRIGLLDVLRTMDADITIFRHADQCGEPVGDVIVRSSRLRATQVSGDMVVRMIDEFPIFAVAAAYARGKTRVENAGELRFKESDRISGLCAALHAIGVQAEETPDGFSIEGGKKPAGGYVDPQGDHRLAMSLAIAGLGAAGPVTISGAEFINESFPGFVAMLNELGANLRTIDDR